MSTPSGIGRRAFLRQGTLALTRTAAVPLASGTQPLGAVPQSRLDRLTTAWQRALVRPRESSSARLSRLDPEWTLPDRNVLDSFHGYAPFPFTHPGATWAGASLKPLRNFPSPSNPEAVAPLLPALEAAPDSRRMVESYGKERRNKARLAARLRLVIEWGATNDAPLCCGEFGVFPTHCRPEHRANWCRDLGEVLAENRIAWAGRGWAGGFGLGRRMVAGKPVVDAVAARALRLKP